ncbi:MAG TPA: SGNH/GDSL hydrolase family protein [Cyclobacteriaceae bacterium]
MNISKIRSIIKTLSINIITFIVLIFITNWLCGLFLKGTKTAGREALPNYKQDPELAKAIFKDYNSLKHQYEPFVEWKVLSYTGTTTHVDEKGFRVHTPPATSTDSSTSVFFFGGSTMWGEGSDDQHTIPALFNTLNPNYRVSNQGQLAYNSRQELDGLINLYSKNTKADVVIFYDGVNDAAFLCPSEIEELPSHRLVPLFRSKLYVERSSFVKEALTKTFAENIIKMINKYSSKKKNPKPLYNCLGEKGKAEEIADIMIKNWEIAHELVTNRGGKFIAVLQPAAFVGKPKVDYLKLDEELGKNFANVYRLIKEKIKAKNYDWVYDLSDKFDKDEYIYIDFCHVSPNGNQIIAEKIDEILKK